MLFCEEHHRPLLQVMLQSIKEAQKQRIRPAGPAHTLLHGYVNVHGHVPGFGWCTFSALSAPNPRGTNTQPICHCITPYCDAPRWILLSPLETCDTLFQVHNTLTTTNNPLITLSHTPDGTYTRAIIF